MKILVLINNQLLEKDMSEAFTLLGEKVELLELKKIPMDLYQETFKNKINSLKPDFLFTINFNGFDQNGFLFDYLEKLELPVVSWEIDHPTWQDLTGTAKKRNSRYLVQFVWDEGYIKEIEELGFENVYYLPLGLSPFFEKEFPVRKTRECKYDLVFVGTSLIEFYHKLTNGYLTRDYFNTKILSEIYQQVFTQYLKNVEIPAIELLRALRNHYQHCFTDLKSLREFEFLCEIRMSRDYRVEMVKKLPEVVVFGDIGWRSVINEKRYMGSVDYYTALATLYNNSSRILNLTLVKNRLDVNQRIFDVFGAGGYLISDKRKNLNIFGKQCLKGFANFEELETLLWEEKVEDDFRQEVSINLKKEILENHRLIHRAQFILSTIKGLFG